jgi:hypothetical protein
MNVEVKGKEEQWDSKERKSGKEECGRPTE